jgi:hypothetical protein
VEKDEVDVDESHRLDEKSRGAGGEGGKNEMNVEDEGDREGSDVSHPGGPRPK